MFKLYFISGLKRWQDYSEPGDELDPGSPLRHTARMDDLDMGDDDLPLGEGTLTRNMGLDMVVVVTKVPYHL